MPVNAVIVASKARKQILKLPYSIQKRCIKAFDRIKKHPLISIKLHGELSDYRKLRIGDYRVLYRFNKKLNTVYIVAIEHRQGVYK